MDDVKRNDLLYKSKCRFCFSGCGRFHVGFSEFDKNLYGNGNRHRRHHHVFRNRYRHSSASTHLHPLRLSERHRLRRFFNFVVDDIKRYFRFYQSRYRWNLSSLCWFTLRFSRFDENLHDDRDGRGWHHHVSCHDHSHTHPASHLYALRSSGVGTSGFCRFSFVDHRERDSNFPQSRNRFGFRKRFDFSRAFFNHDLYAHCYRHERHRDVFENDHGRRSSVSSNLYAFGTSYFNHCRRIVRAFMDDIKRYFRFYQSRYRWNLSSLCWFTLRFSRFDENLHDDRDWDRRYRDVFDDRYCHASAAPASGLFALAFREPARVEHSKRDLGHDSQFGRFSRHTKSIRDKRLSHVRPSSFDGYPYVYANRKRARRH